MCIKQSSIYHKSCRTATHASQGPTSSSLTPHRNPIEGLSFNVGNLCSKRRVHSCVPSATQSTLGLLLEKDSLAVQDGKCLLQSSYFCFPALHSLCMGLRLCDASALQTCVVLVHSIKLFLNAGSVGTGLCRVFIEAFR